MYAVPVATWRQGVSRVIAEAARDSIVLECAAISSQAGYSQIVLELRHLVRLHTKVRKTRQTV